MFKKSQSVPPFTFFGTKRLTGNFKKIPKKIRKFFSQFLVFWELLLSPVVEKVVFVFESFWALDMAPTWTVSGLFFFRNEPTTLGEGNQSKYCQLESIGNLGSYLVQHRLHPNVDDGLFFEEREIFHKLPRDRKGCTELLWEDTNCRKYLKVHLWSERNSSTTNRKYAKWLKIKIISKCKIKHFIINYSF